MPTEAAPLDLGIDRRDLLSFGETQLLKEFGHLETDRHKERRNDYFRNVELSKVMRRRKLHLLAVELSRIERQVVDNEASSEFIFIVIFSHFSWLSTQADDEYHPST